MDKLMVISKGKGRITKYREKGDNRRIAVFLLRGFTEMLLTIAFG